MAKTKLLLALLLVSAASTATTTRGDDDVPPTVITNEESTEPKQKRKIIGAGLLNKILKRKDDKSGKGEEDIAATKDDVTEADDADAVEDASEVDVDAQAEDNIATQEYDDEEEVAPPQPVCKSDASGQLTCKTPESDSESAKATDADEDANNEENAFECKDLDENCVSWSKWTIQAGDVGVCEVHSAYMTQYCPLSCGTCETAQLGYRLSTMLEGGLSIIPFCQDNNFDCYQFAKTGECDKNPEYMSMFCEASCGVCSEESNQFGVGQKLHNYDPVKEALIVKRLEESIEYMKTVRQDRKYDGVVKSCLNKVPDCTLWASQGECENNEQYMKVMCAPACMSCDYLGDTSET